MWWYGRSLRYRHGQLGIGRLGLKPLVDYTNDVRSVYRPPFMGWRVRERRPITARRAYRPQPESAGSSPAARTRLTAPLEVGRYYLRRGWPRKCSGNHARPDGTYDPYFHGRGDWDNPTIVEVRPLTAADLAAWATRVCQINLPESVRLVIGEAEFRDESELAAAYRTALK